MVWLLLLILLLLVVQEQQRNANRPRTRTTANPTRSSGKKAATQDASCPRAAARSSDHGQSLQNLLQSTDSGDEHSQVEKAA